MSVPVPDKNAAKSPRGRRGSKAHEGLYDDNNVDIPGPEFSMAQKEYIEEDLLKDVAYKINIKKIKEGRYEEKVIKALLELYEKDDSTATEEEIDNMILYIMTGSKKWQHYKNGFWWRTNSEECNDFLRMMAQSARKDELDWYNRNPGAIPSNIPDPPMHTARPLDNDRLARIKATEVLFQIVVFQNEEKTTIEMRLNRHMTAQQALEAVIQRLRVNVELKDHAFKVIGKADYFQGNTELINFVHIRNCLMSGTPVKVKIEEVGHSDGNRLQYTYRNMLSRGPSHQEMSIEGRDAHLLKEISVWNITCKTEVTIRSVNSLKVIIAQREPSSGTTQVHLRDATETAFVCVVGQLFHGMRQLAGTMKTRWRALREDGLVHTVFGSPHGTLQFNIPLCNLPREVRLCLTVLYTKEAEKLNEPADRLLSYKKGKGVNFVGWVNFQLFDHRNYWRNGIHDLRIWHKEEKANHIGVVSTNFLQTDATTISLQLPAFARRVRFPEGGEVPDRMMAELRERHHQHMEELDSTLRRNIVNQLRRVREVVQKNPLCELTDVDKHLLWQFRNDLAMNPRALPKFLQSVDWSSPAAVQETHQLLGFNTGAKEKKRQWKKPPIKDTLVALELLDARYASSAVRQYALDILDNLDDSELENCVLQLVQVLKYEPYHYSALARFLLKRSLQSPHLIGHSVFWLLRAEMTNPDVIERHGLIMEEFLRRCTQRKAFLGELVVTCQLFNVGSDVKDMKKEQRIQEMRQMLKDLKLPSTFTLPLDARLSCQSLVLDKCKVMDSKKLPLFLVFTNADPLGSDIYVIFKVGDDLRQDLLTLQMFTIMDQCWKAQGLDMHMSTYKCVACEENVGMIEVVLNAETIANITKKAGGAESAFKKEPMLSWLRQQSCNKTEEGVRTCMWNFVMSCAGYCVATYILGIGDRHNDNIMLKQDGTLFHIDFGHFLGNFKKKFGVKRETFPFVFTPMYAYVLGGEKSPIYKHFVQVAGVAYNIVRRSSHVIIALFALMISTGIPELQKLEDIEWLPPVLKDELDDEQAKKHYEDKIKISLSNKRTLLNDYIHICARS